MRRILSYRFLLVFLFVATALSAESRYGDRAWKAFVEFDQMFVLKAGAERSLSPNWGIKGAIGLSIPGVTTVGYEIVGTYHVRPEDKRFQFDVEFGLPVAYFNVLEGIAVDWDPHVDGPFAGWAPGASAVWGFRFGGGSVLGLKTGVVALFEYQWDAGWRKRCAIVPEFALQWAF